MNRRQRRAEKKLAEPPRKEQRPDIRDLFAEALNHHQAGRLVEAERLYQRVLALDALHADSLHHLGLIAYQTGRHGLAINQIGKAISLNPGEASYHHHLGIVHQNSGELEEAVTCYRNALDRKADQPETLNNLAVVLSKLGRLGEAEACSHRALSLTPGYPEAHYNLGLTLAAQSRFDSAAASYGKALNLRPDYPKAHDSLGTALRQQGRLEEAIACYRRAITFKPDFAEAQNNLGSALQSQGKQEQALLYYRRAVDFKPDFAEAQNNLGLALQHQGVLEEAIARHRKALDSKPNFSEAQNNLGLALHSQGKLEEAIACFHKALDLKADFPEAYNNLGSAFQSQRKSSEAIACYRRALEVKPNFPEALNNLAMALQLQGKSGEAIACCRKALDLRPDFMEARHNLLMSLHYSSRHSSADILAEAGNFTGFAPHPGHPHAFPNIRDPNRRLHIGYVSGDFRAHPVGYFLAGVLEAHDGATVDVTCYSNSLQADAMTERLRKAVPRWRSIAGVSDDHAAAMIAQDGIDILIDLSGHTAGNRLPLFALKPAPLQVSWLGYFGTTGLPAMDYILADRYVVPDGDERYFTEAVWRLPGCYLCYSPHQLDVSPGPFPALSNGFTTFGSFNNQAKVGDETVAVWAEILNRVKDSRLFLKNKSLADADFRAALSAQFAQRGIPEDRLIFEGHSPLADAMAAYNRMDIALDPFSFGGGTTTAETLWMGVPLVTMEGDRWVGRMSRSILATIELDDWVAEDTAHYIEIACRMAADIPKLADLRADLRSRLEGSSFCDRAKFTKGLEAAYRGLWHNWCHPK